MVVNELLLPHQVTQQSDCFQCACQVILGININKVKTEMHFYSARNARIASAVLATAIPSVCPSVRPSVCLSVCLFVRHTPVLFQNDGT